MSEPERVRESEPDEECDCAPGWSGTDALLCWLGAGIFAFLTLCGAGQCSKAMNESDATLQRAKNEARIDK
jgi:hypothetical protein